jgi:type II secretory pathway pseudopilin PulG
VLEITIVLVIVAILIGMAMLGLRSAKSAAYGKEAIATGAGYNDAIAKFRTDHALVNPTAGDMAPPIQGKQVGPKSLLNPAKAYLAPIPDGVASGRVFANMTPNSDCGPTANGTGAPATAQAIVSYCTANPDYGIRVAYKQKTGDPWGSAKVCWYGNMGRLPAC